MTRPALDNSQKVGNSQEVKPTISPFGTFGRYTEIPLDQMTPEQRTAYDFEVKERGEVPGPHKIWLQNSKLLEVMIPVGTYFQKNPSLSDAEREIVVNLINGKWHAAYSNYEHEMIGEKAGLPPEKVQALIAGLPTSFEEPRQQVAYEMTCALIAPRVVPTGLCGSYPQVSTDVQ
jgi:4-carboxymuconolactone decarboxylase